MRLSGGTGELHRGVDQFGETLWRSRCATAGISLRRRDLRRLSVAPVLCPRTTRAWAAGDVHPQAALLQDARAFQRSPAFAAYRTLRQVAEHRLARLMQLGVRQARYVGRAKTLCQLLLAATVANLTLVATKVRLIRDRHHSRSDAACQFVALLLPMILMDRPADILQSGWNVSDGNPRGGFRPHF